MIILKNTENRKNIAARRGRQGRRRPRRPERPQRPRIVCLHRHTPQVEEGLKRLKEPEFSLVPFPNTEPAELKESLSIMGGPATKTNEKRGSSMSDEEKAEREHFR